MLYMYRSEKFQNSNREAIWSPLLWVDGFELAICWKGEKTEW